MTLHFHKIGSLKVVINGIKVLDIDNLVLKRTPENLKGITDYRWRGKSSKTLNIYFFSLERLSIFKWGPENTGCNAQHSFTNLNIYKYSILI